MSPAIPPVLGTFLHECGEQVAARLRVLAAPYSLTDNVAVALLELSGFDGANARLWARAVRLSELTVERNSEWYIPAASRQSLLARCSAEELRAADGLLLSFVSNQRPHAEVPAYLRTFSGLAYHKSRLDLEEGLQEYRNGAFGVCDGTYWLAGVLAAELQDVGVIPRDELLPTFIQGMYEYKEGRRREALARLRQVAVSPLLLLEVAISKHLVGINDRNPIQAKELLNDSLRILRELNNTFGVAQVEHSLGNLLSEQGRRWSEAEELYRDSLRIAKELGHEFGVAQVEHSLANLLARQRGSWSEAEELYSDSLRILTELNNTFGVAQVEHSLANLRSEQGRWSEAEELYSDSLRIGKELGHEFHVAQVEHSFANLLARQGRRWSEAEELYRDSLRIEKKQGHEFGVAQVEHSFANLLARQRGSWSEAEELYRDSLGIGKELGHEFHVAQVEHSLANLLSRQRGRWSEAEGLYRDSLRIGEEVGREAHIAQVAFKYGEFLCREGLDVEKGLTLLRNALEINTRLRNRYVQVTQKAIQRYTRPSKGS